METQPKKIAKIALKNRKYAIFIIISNQVTMELY